MPRITPYLAVAGLLFSCAPSLHSAQAAPLSAAAKRILSGSMPNSTRVFHDLGLKGTVIRVRALPPVQKSVTQVRSSQTVKAAATGPLNFNITKGDYTSAQRAVLENALGTYNAMVTYFGAPAPEQAGKTVTVQYKAGDPPAAYQPLLNPSDTDGGTIYYKYDDNVSSQENAFAFTRLALLAFQGPNNFSYNYAEGKYVEPWQYGFADAAALLVAYATTPTSQKPSFDPARYSLYVLSVYDYFNHPELGNAYIYSQDGVDVTISDFRAAMAQAAWLKVAVQDPLFFAKFNAEYYKLPARKAVDPAKLRSIASGITSKVEGLDFNDWIRRQYVLDTNVTTGQKLYTAILPSAIVNNEDLRSGFKGYAEAFTTDGAGNEAPSVGYGSVNAFDEKGNNINSLSSELKASNLLNFGANPKYPGQASFGAGFSTLGTPDRARVSLKLRYQSAESTAVFPAIGSGAPTKLNYYGVTSNGDSGNLTISPSNGTAETVTVGRGAWAGTKTYVPGPSVTTSLKLGERTFFRNTAWLASGDDSRGIGFVLDGAATSTSFTLNPGSGASNVRMISLPFYPLESDEAAILSTTPSALAGHLARYRPNLAAGSLNNGVITFGINGDRHELYPYISGPVTPGRGYWLSADAAAQRVIKGSEPPRTTPYEVPLQGGWNQIGVPFNRAFSVEAIKVRYGGFSAVSLANALLNGWVRPGIWMWQPGGGYKRADGVVGASVKPFVGYYIYAVPERGVSLVFDPSASAEPATATAGWTVNLTAATTTTRDTSNRFGVSTQIPAAKPPAAVQVVTLRFLTSGSGDDDSSGAGAASGWADSFVPEFGREGTWQFVVDGTKNKERVTMSWGELKGVPSDVKLVLIDKKTASQTRLTSGGSYKWNSEGKSRAFTLRATRIAIPAISVAAVKSNSFNFGVTLNVPANGRLEVRDGSGNTVALLKSGSFEAKKEKFIWNGRKTNGQSSPAGRYVVTWTPEDVNDKKASRSFIIE